jgi:hypothetical protein
VAALDAWLAMCATNVLWGQAIVVFAIAATRPLTAQTDTAFKFRETEKH